MDGATINAEAGLTRTLAEQASAFRYEALPADVREVARQCILDYFGVGLAGADDELVRLLLAEMVEAGGATQAAVIGYADRLPILSAALVNGAAAHALDYDDVNLAMPGHPTVAILPALLALAEAKQSSGREVLTAFVAGYETQCRIGMTMRPGHYARGFHATGTVGTFGAAVACARLLGLDAEATARAMGIAGTQAAGLKSQFGTMCKPFHAGKAAQSGLLAARLAARGFSSRTDLVECDQGFARTHSPDFAAETALAKPPGGHFILANLFKYHAACYMTHAAIECAHEVRKRYHPPLNEIAAIKVTAHRGSDRICNIPAPTDGLQSKFSLRQTVAMALTGVDTASLGAYSVANASDKRLMALRDQVEFDFRDQYPEAGAEMSVMMLDGTVLRAEWDAGKPSTDIADQGRRLTAKFDALAEPVIGHARSTGLRAMITDLDNATDVGALCQVAAAR
ncbi:MAG: MmgE/PrpD family protein [Alphaproteobacteria bacterium]|nr:MmgE/PrpD family protein [Alphaproteobacteria bacterium]